MAKTERSATPGVSRRELLTAGIVAGSSLAISSGSAAADTMPDPRGHFD